MVKTFEDVERELAGAYGKLRGLRDLLEETIKLQAETEEPYASKMQVVVNSLRAGIYAAEIQCDILLRLRREVVAQQGRQLRFNV
jgi:hypothetical protein